MTRSGRTSLCTQGGGRSDDVSTFQLNVVGVWLKKKNYLKQHSHLLHLRRVKKLLE